MEIGKLYRIKHQRKGSFNLRVTKFDESDEWVEGIIVDSKASAMLEYNEKYSGDSITIRKPHFTFKPF